MAVSETSICNRALDKLKLGPITSLSDNTEAARACNRNYEDTRDLVLRDHPWNFAIKRTSLAASATTPTHGFDNAFPVPNDYLRILEVTSNTLPWIVEQHLNSVAILTNASASLPITYIAQTTNTALFDPIFVDALATMLALQMIELQPSTSLRQSLERHYAFMTSRGKLADGREQSSRTFQDDAWVTDRL